MPYTPDPVTATTTAGTDFERHSEGSHVMVCVDVINLGRKVQTDPMGKNPPRLVPRAALVFASGECDARGELLTVQTEFTVSMHEKSNLRPFLASWRGKSYSDPEAQAGAPLHKLAGVPALVTIEHKPSRDGSRTYANIASISPLPKQMRADVPDLSDAYRRGEWWGKKIAAYKTDADQFEGSHPTARPQPVRGDDTDDLPF